MEQDQAILDQLEGIRDSQRQQALIADPEPVVGLLAEYEDAVFRSKIEVGGKEATRGWRAGGCRKAGA